MYREYHRKEELMFYTGAKLKLELLEPVGVQKCCNAIKMYPPQTGSWHVAVNHLQKLVDIE